MPANPVDVKLLLNQRCGQGCRSRRCSMDAAKRRWYAVQRTRRLSQLGAH